MESTLCWPTTPEVYLMYPVIFHWRKLIYPMPKSINCKWIFGYGSVSTSFLSDLGPLWLEPV